MYRKDKDSSRFRLVLCEPMKYHEIAQPFVLKLKDKFYKLETDSPKFSRYRFYIDEFVIVSSAAKHRPKEARKNFCNLICFLIQDELIDDEEFRNELCLLLMEKYIEGRVDCDMCPDAEAEEEFQKILFETCRKTKHPIRDYLKSMYPEQYQRFGKKFVLEFDDERDCFLKMDP